MRNAGTSGDGNLNRRAGILLAFAITFALIVPVSGNIPSHINPTTVNESASNLYAQQLALINELLFYRSEIFVSLNKGDFKDARENFDNYMKILQGNNDILIQINGDVYSELRGSANTLNLTQDDINQLRALYDEGRAAYQNNQIDKAIQIALKARKTIRNLSSLQQELIMKAVAQYPGVNITLYENGSSSFDNLLKEVQKRWFTVELTLFDETITSFSVYPSGGEFGDVMNINGNLILQKNGSGLPNANILIKIDNESVTNLITGKNGRFNYTFMIPYKKPGNHSMQADFVPLDEPLLPSSTESTFSIKPANTWLTIKVNPGYWEFGDILSVSGSLLTKNASGVSDADITISLDNKTLSNVRTNENGSYNYEFMVPVITKGYHTVDADFIPSMQPLFQSGNKTIVEVMQANTTIEIAGQKVAYQDDYLNVKGKLRTLKNHSVPASNITVLFDTGVIGNAPVKNGDFSFSYWINKNMSLGNHVVIMKFGGESLFLPSENSTQVEIKTKPVFYTVKQKVSESNYSFLFLILGFVGIVLGILYLRKEKVLMLRIDALTSAIRARISKAKTETPQISLEPLKEVEIEKVELIPEVKEEFKADKIYAHIHTLIMQKQFRESISFSFKNAKDYISSISEIKNTPQQTHWEFYDLVKNTTAFADEFLELTELYEAAMYSNSRMDAEQALKAMDLLKKIYNSPNNE